MSPLPSNSSMLINDHSIKVTTINGADYICLTDMAKSSGADRALHSWLRSKNTILFLGLWEQTHNTTFNLHEFVKFKSRTGENTFNPSVKEWIEATRAVGIQSKSGRYGGTYAHKDIAFEFGTWLSPEFKLLIITEFQRLKDQEQEIAKWDSRRYLSKVNYRLHTDAIKEHIIPKLGLGALRQYTYTNEADMLNRLVFGQTANEWKNANPEIKTKQKNQRDFATAQQLVLLANLETLNSHLISEGHPQSKRVDILAKEVQRQYNSLIFLESLDQTIKEIQ